MLLLCFAFLSFSSPSFPLLSFQWQWFICSNDIIATIAVKHKTFELDKPGWIAALVDAHKKKEKYIMVKNVYENQKN